MTKVPTALWKNLLAIQIYGANTGVGKTVFSTLLGAHFARRRDGEKKKRKWRVGYIKPVSTGPLSDADDRYVRKFTGQDVDTLWQFGEPVSPHVAARGAADFPSNDKIARLLSSRLQDTAWSIGTNGERAGIALVETAGGVLSPGPSGTVQADIYRPLRLPALLVGDHRLGGIASTISAAESLILRGYDIDAIVCFDDKGVYENADYLTKYFNDMKISAFSVPWIPDLEDTTEQEEFDRMSKYYQSVSQGQEVGHVAEALIASHVKRLSNLDSMAERTKTSIWHPFTQHKHIKAVEDVLVFDSAYGDHFQVKHTSASLASKQDGQKEAPLCYPAFDGSASWWTQGLGHGNPALALRAAYAAGRYGHIMFAGATHQPALELAERLLQGLDNPRLKKVFYTDNGSTATEVGIKMALRAASKHYNWDSDKQEIGVLGLKGSYHGDTIGAMDASEPCLFNEKVDWYRGRGYWFDYPVFKLIDGRWKTQSPPGMEDQLGKPQVFSNMDEIFDLEHRGESTQYDTYIREVLDRLVRAEGKRFGALIMEPVILGAGGMMFVDPLFQQRLVHIVREYNFDPTSDATPEIAHKDVESWTGLPVMFDEVFTGLYRLGRFSSASFLGVHPDISVHAKLLTGGLLPLSVTAASSSIFDAFWGDEKSEALLHGHSYTAHPIGCYVANTSLQTMHELDTTSAEWTEYRKSWHNHSIGNDSYKTSARKSQPNSSRHAIWSMWTPDFVMKLSKHDRVDYVNTLGSVLAVALKDTSGSGYASSAAIDVRDALLNEGAVHSRVLGNVIYFMASMTSESSSLLEIEKTLARVLG